MCFPWVLLAVAVLYSGKAEALWGTGPANDRSRGGRHDSPLQHQPVSVENDDAHRSQRITMSMNEYDSLRPLIDCCAAISPEANKAPCLEMLTASWRRLGVAIRSGAFVGSEEAFMFFQLLHCERAPGAAARDRCVRDVLGSHRERGVAVDALVVHRSSASSRGGVDVAASAPTADGQSPELVWLSDVVLPVDEPLTAPEAQFYAPLIECAAGLEETASRQECAQRYLQRWERMGVAVPRRRALSAGERILLHDLLSCEGLPTASARQAACLRTYLDAAEKAGVHTAPLMAGR